PLLVGKALLLVCSRFVDLHGLPRPLCRRPRAEELHHAAINGPATLVDPPAAMDLQCLVESKAKITLLLGGDRSSFLVGIGNLLRRLHRLVPFLLPGV